MTEILQSNSGSWMKQRRMEMMKIEWMRVIVASAKQQQRASAIWPSKALTRRDWWISLRIETGIERSISVFPPFLSSRVDILDIVHACVYCIVIQHRPHF